MSRRTAAALLAGLALIASCTRDAPRTAPTLTPATVSPTPSPEGIDLLLVAGPDGHGYVEGMEVAIRQVNASGGVAGEPLRLQSAGDLETAGPWPAALVVGRGEVVTRLRPEVESAGDPVVVVGDDLYSPRRLYRQVFQASLPELWQAGALARLLVADLRLSDLVLVSGDRDARLAYGAAVAEEGADLEVVDPGAPGATARRVRDADAVILPGPAEEIERLAGPISGLADPPLLALGAAGLSVAGTDLPPGTLAPYHYAWSGWAEPIPRVGRFRDRFERDLGELPDALQQEGYDAIRVLAGALRRTGGRGGEALIRALEAVRDAAYSSVPLRLGPDDHVLLPQGQLGVYAVGRPGTEAPGEALAANPWRPVMRTFTYNGERVTIVRRDLRVFFPGWRHPAPSPEYQRSRYGIASPAGTFPR